MGLKLAELLGGQSGRAVSPSLALAALCFLSLQTVLLGLAALARVRNHSVWLSLELKPEFPPENHSRGDSNILL